MFFFGKKKPKRRLKVGLIHGNRPLVERAIQPAGKVTIGTHDSNTFVIPSAKLPKKFIVFRPQGDRYLLSFLPGMEGKIAVKETAMPFSALKQRGIVETKKGVHTLSISDQTRGKLTFEGCRLLFRFEDSP